MKKQAISAAELLLTAFIWGVAFVAQSVGMENVGPFTFTGIRNLMGAAVLTPFILIRDIGDAEAEPFVPLVAIEKPTH